MAKWRYTGDDSKDEDFERESRIRKKTSVLKSKNEIRKSFERDESEWKDDIVKGLFAARVVEVHKRYVFVNPEPIVGEVNTRDVWLGTVVRKFLLSKREERNFVAVGDRVLCERAEKGAIEVKSELPQCTVVHLSPRKSQVARIDPSQRERNHVIASNIDHLLIVSSYRNPKVRWGLIDRYLVLAESEGISPTIILNKIDLIRDDLDFQTKCLAHVAHYRKIGYHVLEIQATVRGFKKTNEYKELVCLFKSHITLLSGHSGVGKSSLVNQFNPEIIQSVEPIPEFYKGRHTTTFASFIRLGTGGFVIDTPGIRSFGIKKISPFEISSCFPEMRDFITKCKYRACTHCVKPNCSVMEAVAAGILPEWRYRSYVGILKQEELDEENRSTDPTRQI